MKRVLTWIKSMLLCLIIASSSTATADILVVGGTGSAEPLMKLLFDEFGKQSPDLKMAIVTPSLGSSGGLTALASGKIDLAIVARPLKAQEAAVLGRRFALGRTPFVIVTSKGQRLLGFSLKELSAVYEGQLNVWDNGDPIRLILRTRDDFDTTQLKSMSPDMEKAVLAADQRPGMVYGNDDMDTLELLTRTPGSLGPSSLGFLKTTGSALTVLPINGTLPSVATLKNGSYPWHKTLTVVLPLNPTPATQRFADYLESGRAREILQRYDYLPAQP